MHRSRGRAGRGAAAWRSSGAAPYRTHAGSVRAFADNRASAASICPASCSWSRRFRRRFQLFGALSTHLALPPGAATASRSSAEKPARCRSPPCHCSRRAVAACGCWRWCLALFSLLQSWGRGQRGHAGGAALAVFRAVARRALPVSLATSVAVMVLAGARVLYQERPVACKWLATLLAVTGGVSRCQRRRRYVVETWLVALGYTVLQAVGACAPIHPSGHWLDIVARCPRRCGSAGRQGALVAAAGEDNAHLWALMPVLAW